MTYLAPALLLLTASAQAPPASALLARVPEERPSTDLTTGGLVWSYISGAIPPQIALADRGGLVFARDFDADVLFLLSSFDADPPVPIWTLPGADSITGIAAAAEADVLLFASVRRDPPFHTTSTLKKFSSRSSTPEWRYTFPDQYLSQPFVDLSNDGETIVSFFAHEASGTTVLRVHDPATGVALRTIVHPTEMNSTLDVSADGSVAAFNADQQVHVYELATGRHLFSTPGGIFGNQSLSGDGRRLVTLFLDDDPERHVRVYTGFEDGYRLTLDVPTPSHVWPRSVALSEDGSTMAGAWHGSGNPVHVIVRAFLVETGVMTMEHVDEAHGFMIPAGVAISADGSRFVATLHGNAAGGFPELVLYARDSYVPLAVHPEGGSIFGVRMSPDGRRYLASRAPTNRGYDYAMIELYEAGGEDLVVRGAPRVGSTITFELHGAPGSRAALLRSFSLARSPTVFPEIGVLHLDPATLTSTPMGIVPPSGVATYSTVVSTVPGMIGRTLWFQGITSRPRRFTNDFVQLTILP